MNPLRTIKRFLDKILGTKSDELFWKFRHFFDIDWAKNYINDLAINHPHRKLLIDEISKFYPFESVLELGSASGANLFLLAKKYPKVNFWGIDISEKAIVEGRKFFVKKNIKNIKLENRSILNLENFEDKSIDIIFSDAAIIYIGQKEINLVIKEMFRIAKKAIILCEQHTDDKSFYSDRWIHNYKEVIERVYPPAKIVFIKISEETWSGDWGRYGYIIEIIL